MSSNEKKAEVQEEKKVEKTNFPKGSKFYKSKIAGLAFALSENDEREVVGVDEVRFKPYEMWNEQKGESYRIGFLVTHDPNVQEMANEDANCVEITEKEYTDSLKAKKTKAIPY